MKWHGAWLYGGRRTCAELAAGSCGTSHASGYYWWILKNKINKITIKLVTHVEPHASAASPLKRAENSAIYAFTNQKLTVLYIIYNMFGCYSPHVYILYNQMIASRGGLIPGIYGDCFSVKSGGSNKNVSWRFCVWLWAQEQFLRFFGLDCSLLETLACLRWLPHRCPGWFQSRLNPQGSRLPFERCCTNTTTTKKDLSCQRYLSPDTQVNTKSINSSGGTSSVNSLMCWFCVSTLGLVLFQIVLIPQHLKEGETYRMLP